MIPKGFAMRVWVTFGMAAGAAAWLAAAHVAGQAGAPANLPGAAAARAFVATLAKNYKPPRTPWGDPDISGVFTSKDEANTPFERPAEWAGRRIEDITPAELSSAVADRQQRAVDRAPFLGGGSELIAENVAIGVPIHWLDHLSARNSRPWFVIDPPDGKVPPLTAEAAARVTPLRPFVGDRPDSYTDRDLADRCLVFSTGGVWQTPVVYGNSYQILQTPDYVIMRYEMVHEARMIPLDGRPHASSRIRGIVGDSRGYWDGDSLVVVTTNFNEQLEYRDFPNVFVQNRRAGGGPVRNLRLIERFTRIASNKVEWTTTVDDPTMWRQPWTYSFPLTEDDQQMIYEYACHEGNYSMANILSAGRAADKAARPNR
jgi:hypothetical protein